jgi:outer membrane lipoprotein carrier protein
MRLPLAICMIIASLPAFAADGVSMLRDYLQQTTSARARFAQIQVDKNLRQLQQATGTMEFVRPGKFRWTYQKPYEQLIVGDGTRVWIYDKDLNQVTVRKLDKALGSTPAALLAGSNEIEKEFSLKAIGSRDGLEWLEAVPKTKDGTFERIQLGFGANGLESMELHDQFGQTTLIKFASIERNVKLPPDDFKFVPPKGADVIGE